MNKQTLSTVPDENEMEELLNKIQPVPSEHFHQKMRQATWQNEQRQAVVMKKLRLKIAFAVITLAILTMFLITPPGRTWAQEAVQFFTRVNSTTIELPDGQAESMNELTNQLGEEYDLPLIPVFIPTVPSEMATIPGCETPQKSQSYHCRVALAESKLGFDLKELPENINDWELESISVNTDLQIAVMSFDLDFKYIGFDSHSSLIFSQGVGDFSKLNSNKIDPWNAVPADKVESVSIGAFKGEYVKGRFGFQQGSKVLVWSEEFKDQRLAWSEGTRWYLFQFSPNLNLAGTMGKDQLIHLAESLADDSSVKIATPLNPDHLLSVSDAEKISGFDLKAPTLLPLDTDFSYARYLPDEQQVQLVYGQDESLIIHEWQGEPVEYKKPLNKYEFDCEMVEMNGEDAFYCSFEGTRLRSFLWWHKDGLNYQMDNDSFLGGRIDREKMLLIAESMQDINDFRKKNDRNYEQVVLYEQALGIDAKKFPETPAGWVFASFWSDAKAKCIGLFYTSTAGQGSLFVSQCKTDKRSDTSGFPFWSIKRVNVGGAKGKYIEGYFVTTDDGKQVWDSTFPAKQLYWQHDELWTQIVLHGDAALLYDEENLISLAESLR